MVVTNRAGVIGASGVNAAWNVVVDNNFERELVKRAIVTERQKWPELVIHIRVKGNGVVGVIGHRVRRRAELANGHVPDNVCQWAMISMAVDVKV